MRYLSSIQYLFNMIYYVFLHSHIRLQLTDTLIAFISPKMLINICLLMFLTVLPSHTLLLEPQASHHQAEFLFDQLKDFLTENKQIIGIIEKVIVFVICMILGFYYLRAMINVAISVNKQIDITQGYLQDGVNIKQKFFTGQIIISQPLQDTGFMNIPILYGLNVDAKIKAIKIVQKVEILEWKQKSCSWYLSAQNAALDWRQQDDSVPIQSGKFNNPANWILTTQSFYNENARLNELHLDKQVMKELYQPSYILNPKKYAIMLKQYKRDAHGRFVSFDDRYIYFTPPNAQNANKTQDILGTQRVSFQIYEPMQVSIVGRLQGNTIKIWRGNIQNQKHYCLEVLQEELTRQNFIRNLFWYRNTQFLRQKFRFIGLITVGVIFLLWAFPALMKILPIFGKLMQQKGFFLQLPIIFLIITILYFLVIVIVWICKYRHRNICYYSIIIIISIGILIVLKQTISTQQGETSSEVVGAVAHVLLLNRS